MTFESRLAPRSTALAALFVALRALPYFVVNNLQPLFPKNTRAGVVREAERTLRVQDGTPVKDRTEDPTKGKDAW